MMLPRNPDGPGPGAPVSPGGPATPAGPSTPNHLR